MKTVFLAAVLLLAGCSYSSSAWRSVEWVKPSVSTHQQEHDEMFCGQMAPSGGLFDVWRGHNAHINACMEARGYAMKLVPRPNP